MPNYLGWGVKFLSNESFVQIVVDALEWGLALATKAKEKYLQKEILTRVEYKDGNSKLWYGLTKV
jgi:hypothetical protein